MDMNQEPDDSNLNLLRTVIKNTLAVFTNSKDQKDVWRSDLVKARSQFMMVVPFLPSDRGLVAFFSAVIDLLDADGDPLGLGDHLTGEYREAWHALIVTLAQLNLVSDQPLEPLPEPPPRGISRRAMMGGLAVLGIAVVGGGLTWLALSQKPQISSSSSSTPPPSGQPLGTTLLIYHGHSDKVHSVSWSPNNSRIASTGFDKTVQVWDAADGGHI